MESIYLKVTQDFVPTDKDEKVGGKNTPISVERGDIIFDVRKLEGGWLTGKNLNTGKSGRFPSSCTAKLSDPSNEKDTSGSNSSLKTPDSKAVDKKEPASSTKPLKTWQRDTNGASDPKATEPNTGLGNLRRPANPRPFALSSRKPKNTNDSGERKETSGDSGVGVEEDYYLNDEPPAKKPIGIDKKPLQTVGKFPEVKKPSETETVKKPLYEPTYGRFQPRTLYSPGLYSKRPSVSKLKSAFLDQDPNSASTKTPDMKDKAEKKGSEAIELKKQPVGSQTGKKTSDKSPGAKIALAKDEEDDDCLYANYTEVDEPKPSDENKNDKADGGKTGTTGKKVNIKENPLSGDESGAPYHSYQVPQSAPDKPSKAGGCSECDEPHIYAAPTNYVQPPSLSPEATQDKYDFDPTETSSDVNKKKDKPKQPLVDKPKDKAKTDEAKRRSYNRMASYESIGNIGPDKSKHARSNESIKEAAVKAVKRTKNKIVSSSGYPRMRIIGGITLGVVIGVFLFLMLYLLAMLPVLSAVVAGFIVGFICAITLGFLDRKRALCITLLVFPSLFAYRGKLAIWIAITFLLIAGPLCNFVGNVNIIASHRGCVLGAAAQGNESDANGSTAEGYYSHPLVQRYEKMARDIEDVVNTTLWHMNDRGAANSSGNYNSTTLHVCTNYLLSARDMCARSTTTVYKFCISRFRNIGKEAEVRKKCEELNDENICRGLSDSIVENTCKKFDLLRCKKTLLEIKDVIRRWRGQAMIGGLPPAIMANGKEKCCGFVSVLIMLLPLLILLILYEAYRYHKLYMSMNNFDNQYLTSHFKTIEDTRKTSGSGDGLIPLKKGELQRYIQPTSWQFTVVEKDHMLKSFAAYFLYLIFALLILLADHYLYITIKNSQQGVNEDLNKTNNTESINNGSAFVCLPGVHVLQDVYIICIAALLGILLLMITMQPFVLRLRHYIASKFYRRRERKRIAYLYYKLLEERKAFLKSVIDKINLRSEENYAMDRLDTVRVLAWNFGTVETVLTGLGVNLRECMVCGRGLSRKYIYCSTESCEAVYCRTCFWDLENKCLGCMINSNPVSRSSSYIGNVKRKKQDAAQGV